jgi:putative Holliday junction resolvase
MSETVLGLDVGEARIGLARAGAGSSFAFGRGWIDRSNLKADLRELRRIAEQEGAGTLVVGLPRRSDGGDSEQTRRVREFARALEEDGFTVLLEDERFTTRIAGQQLARGSLPRGKRQVKGLLDEAAAVLILETWLQRQAAGKGGPEA